MGVEGMARDKTLASRAQAGRRRPSPENMAREFRAPEARRISVQLLLPPRHQGVSMQVRDQGQRSRPEQGGEEGHTQGHPSRGKQESEQTRVHAGSELWLLKPQQDKESIHIRGAGTHDLLEHQYGNNSIRWKVQQQQ